MGKVINEDLGGDAVDATRGNVAARVGALSCEEVGGWWGDRVGFGKWGCVEVSGLVGGAVVKVERCSRGDRDGVAVGGGGG